MSRLRLTSPQAAALTALAQATFVARTADLLRECFPAHAAGMPITAMRQHVEQAMARAASLGIHTERGIAGFATLSLLAGFEFAAIPAVATVMQSSAGSPDQKVALLLDALAASA